MWTDDEALLAVVSSSRHGSCKRRIMTDMAPVVWALVGLLAAALGILATALFAAIGRVDGLREHTDVRLDRLHDEVHDLRDEVRDVRSAVTSLDQRLTVAGG